MAVFHQHTRVINEYSKYVGSFLNIRDEGIRSYVETELGSGKFWPEPLIQFNPYFAEGASIADLCDKGTLHTSLRDVFAGLKLWKHQSEALRRGADNHSFVVTSGTGSGKSLCFLGTIFNRILKPPSTESGIRAIIVYPMNALINSQSEEIEKYQQEYERRANNPFPITFAQYTGQEKEEQRAKVRSNPPHILLTNYLMLELILTRLDEEDLRRSISKNLEVLVFDELHTYRGRQGSDVSLLIRRIQASVSKPLIFIGTSATMVSSVDAGRSRAEVAKFASTLFGSSIKEENIVGETLRRLSTTEVPSKSALSQLVRDGIEIVGSPALHPFVAWLESRIALKDQEGRLVRGRPQSLDEMSSVLSEDSGETKELCKTRLRSSLEGMGSMHADKAALPFKIHQFVGQTGNVYSTLQPPSERTVTLSGGSFVVGPQGNVLPIFPLVFSRATGHEFLCVTRNASTKKLEPRDFRERVSSDDEDDKEAGYIILEYGEELLWNPENDFEMLPDTWFTVKKNGTRDLKKEYRDRVPKRIYCNETGEFSEEPIGDASIRGWFISFPLLFDPTSGQFFDPKTSENFKLMRIGNEGRSTATTVLSFSVVDALHNEGFAQEAQKLLSFMDNRQDAALQAGHFNDFVKVGQLRSAIYHALKQRDGGSLDHTEIGLAIFKILALSQEEYAKKPVTIPRLILKENEEALRDLILYRLLYDLRRGWRVNLPNLEQCALLRIRYKGLEEIAAMTDIWKEVGCLDGMKQADRLEFLEQVLDYFRTSYAFSHSHLEYEKIEVRSKAIRERLKTPWTLEPGERIDEPNHLRVHSLPPNTRNVYTVSVGPSSAFAKYVLMVSKQHGAPLSKGEYVPFIEKVLDVLSQAGFLETRDLNSGVTLYRLIVDRILWTMGDGEKAFVDKVRNRAFRTVDAKPNSYFHDFYRRDFHKMKSLVGFEHTAQVSNEKRIEREDDFRSGKISALFCSPTMELGIDIRTLHVVHMRNVPPNPANYAQRSGRAGRGGQAALIFTYCSNYSPHDNHYFKNSADMVAGAVAAPRIDLLNEELLVSHLYAVYLAEVGMSELDQSLADLLDESDKEKLLLKLDVKAKLILSDERKTRVVQIFDKAIRQIKTDLASKSWYDNEWATRKLNEAPQRFDKSLNRWRELYRAAYGLLTRATGTVMNTTIQEHSKQKQEAYRDQKQANRQIALLKNQEETRRSSRQISEFYPYRYLAAEGFLPGYNFTRLPIRTYVETDEGGEYISRPRFMALREFGPKNLVYHDGAKYRVKQLLLPDLQNSIEQAKVAKQSGYILMGSDFGYERCPFTDVELSNDHARELYFDLVPMCETRTESVERISCEEEERTSTGFEIKTFFRVNQKKEEIVRLSLASHDVELLKIQYLPAATLVQVNDKWRASSRRGFLVGVKTGLWKKEEDAGEKDPHAEENRRIRLYASDTADALYIQPVKALGLTTEGIVTLQYALKRAIESLFQMESRELSVVKMGETDQPNILIYEAAEGSLGILSQLVHDPKTFRRILEEAYALCYFKDGVDTQPDNPPASYDDLLSYFNQRDHNIINRHLIRDALEKLMSCEATYLANPAFASYEEQYRVLEEQRDPNSSTEEKFLKFLFDRKLHLPDAAQQKIPGIYVQPDFTYKPNVCIFCDGTPHDDPMLRNDDSVKRTALKAAGYQVLAWYYRDSLEDFVNFRPDIFFKVR